VVTLIAIAASILLGVAVATGATVAVVHAATVVQPAPTHQLYNYGSG